MLRTGAWFLSNAYKATSFLGRVAPCGAPCVGRMAVGVPKMEPAWLQKVEELSTRGITAKDLLTFYKQWPA